MPTKDTELQNKISKAISSAKQPLTHEEVTQIIRQVLSTFDYDASNNDNKLYSEIEGLARYIRTARSEIASIRPKDITSEHIPDATDQLDAVVGATEEATNKIMDECDKISSIASALSPEQSEQLTDCVTRIFEACNFQDLTGQRITKVVTALKTIEVKILALLSALGDENAAAEVELEKPPEPAAPQNAEDALLNGPQMPGQGVSQDDIDKLFG